MVEGFTGNTFFFTFDVIFRINTACCRIVLLVLHNIFTFVVSRGKKLATFTQVNILNFFLPVFLISFQYYNYLILCFREKYRTFYSTIHSLTDSYTLEIKILI